MGGRTSNVDIKASEFDKLVHFATEHQINLVLPGPEQPLVDGIEHVFRAIGIPVFGPTPKAALMEGSKAFSKDFMARHAIPTAAYANFTDHAQAEAYVQAAQHDLVIKASGLAAGKGVLIPQSKEEALQGLEEIMVKREFGQAGDEVVIEEFLSGQELSVLAFCDGYTILPLPAAQDHKRIGEGDTGPNTGGMGAYSPAPCATASVNETIMKTILQPSLDGMRKDGIPFVGLLFVGIMLTAQGPKVLEYNVRFGDPETQTLLPLLAPETDLAEILLACVDRRLDCVQLKVSKQHAVSVVLAAPGYPSSYPKGSPISIGALPKDVVVFHAGTVQQNAQIVTAGGRVLTVTARADTLQAAADLAYRGIEAVKFDGAIYRRDIAHRALKAPAVAKMNGMSYADAGVSIDAGNALVDNIKAVVKATARPGSDSIIGGFGGLFDLKAAGYRDPIIVSGTDGVGTKLKIASLVNKHDTIGVDLVAMSVNDLIVQGAEPLFFLDYFACSTLDVHTAAAVVTGVAQACKESGCALVGGETAEMPGLYHGEDYDLAGFAVGAVERNELLPRPDIQPGDVLLGLASSGCHSNGFSLIRKVVEKSGLAYSDTCPWDASVSLGEALLIPTKLYVKQTLPVMRAGLIKGMSHITGGGFTENVPRMFPQGLGAHIDLTAWDLPPVWQWLKQQGNIANEELARTFNCGVGMVIAVDQSKAEVAIKALQKADRGHVYIVGTVTDRPGVSYTGMETWQ
ncbi:uncharacterized protein L969DRAFT_91626 [Mixia osmundae IAM 14324]|uniref:uncharacterized protein n=1 Tax=Mixia osmundae (strain CBS 9802 / IAM 14324 / JCM 22182 / KY 12970) TaxID=764103 RepID=UPI0004A55521|nr:uncharacterized protein L969DRAFT_91626 [Mixia osmundae IAM 14324]KEI42162.1 hypothetical protein L969DRAFT_91626 [Mixia osmundae IAM 14324]